jgi:putative ABC transport system permease protein
VLPSFRIPLRFLRGNHARLALTVVALALGVALVCAIDLVNRAVLRAFVELIDTMAGRAALQITVGEGALFPEDVASLVATTPDVEIAVPVVVATAFAADGSGELLTVHGVDVANDTAVRVYDTRGADGLLLDDPLVFLSQPDSIVLTRAFASRRDLSVGDRIVLETGVGRRAFTVRGLLEPSGVARVFGGNLAVMDLFAAEAAFGRPGFVNRIDVVVKREGSVARVADAIRGKLPAGLQVEAPSQRKVDLHKAMQSLHVLLDGVGVVALIAAFLIAFNRLSGVFEARAWQIGVLRAAGVRTRTVWWELVKESLVLGAAGVLLGIPTGVVLGRALLPAIASATALNYKLIVPEATLALRIPSLLLAGVLGLSAALFAAALPAWRASRVRIAETIRGRGVEQHEGRDVWMWWARFGIVGAIVAAVALQAATHDAAWGLLATALVAIAATLAAQPLVRLACALFRMRAPSAVSPAERHVVAILTHCPRRAALTVAMLGIGIGSVLWLRMIAHSFEKSAIDALGQAIRADLVVSSARIASGYLESPIDEAVAKEVEAVPGVRAVAGVRITDWRHADGPIAIDAFDPIYFADPAFGRWRLIGRHTEDVWAAVARGEAVVASSNFAQNIGAGVGDTIQLETPTGPLRLEVAGITMDFASPRGTLEMSRELYRRRWNDTQVNRVLVRTESPSDAPAIRLAIARALGDKYNLRILSSGELLEYFAAQVRRAFAPLDVLAGMALLVVVVGMSDTLAAGVLERTRELGVARAIGARRSVLRRMVVAEGLTLGVLGLVLALCVGLTLGTLWVETTFTYLLGWRLELETPYVQVVVLGLITLIVCTVGALLPAVHASRLDPAAALRCE